MKNNNWIPLKSGKLPKSYENVQITYLNWNTKVPTCDGMAYISDEGDWCWALDGELINKDLKITAWRYLGDAYVEPLEDEEESPEEPNWEELVPPNDLELIYHAVSFYRQVREAAIEVFLDGENTLVDIQDKTTKYKALENEVLDWCHRIVSG